MVNRNAGAGTRVLIDKLLDGARPQGYANQPKSHNAVAAAIAQGRADWGVAIEPVAKLYGLGFLPVAPEHYDFLLVESRRDRPAVKAFLAALRDPRHGRASPRSACSRPRGLNAPRSAIRTHAHHRSRRLEWVGQNHADTKLIPRLNARGLRVSTLKHAHHGFDLDQPGKDSFMHRAAGATEVIVSSAKRWAVLHELRERAGVEPARPARPSCRRSISFWSRASSATALPKLEIHRLANGKPLLYPDDPHIVAIACDSTLPHRQVPVVDLNDIEAMADVLLEHAAPIARRGGV